ncbi:MAG: type II toxin-antitoxin system VapC family toxin [Acetobacteraceae bacterium]|nr:type II toxin-antitoxin system VapC family toxin [Acetobacteraceae bacterium]
MKLLLDTHVLLWWLSDDARLGLQVRELIADPANDVLVSTGSLWEIVVKMRIGKLDADIAEICRAVQAGGFTLTNIGVVHLQTLAELPTHHRDPFDHLLIAQAISEDAALVSADETLGRYPVRLLTCADQAA